MFVELVKAIIIMRLCSREKHSESEIRILASVYEIFSKLEDQRVSSLFPEKAFKLHDSRNSSKQQTSHCITFRHCSLLALINVLVSEINCSRQAGNFLSHYCA